MSWNLDRLRASLDDDRRKRAVNLAVERGLVEAGSRPLEQLVQDGALSATQAETLLSDVDAAPLVALAGRYELQAKLGEGGMGQVWRAYDRHLGRLVAVKFPRPDLLMDNDYRQRLEREARSVAMLSHPNIVTVYDLGESAGRAFIVMEYVEGMTFSASGDRRERLQQLEEIARGVAAAHEKGVVHRDLKPANVLVTAAGHPKVTDFGLAHLVGSSKLTATGAVVGTAAYMAPEQVDPSRATVSSRTDVWALGVMLYEVLSGRRPFEKSTATETMFSILTDDPPALRAVPWDLRVICFKAMEKMPTDRYASAADFADDLRRHLQGEPIRATPPSLGSRVGRFVRRRRAAVLGVTTACAMLLAAYLLLRWKESEKRRERSELYAELDRDLELLRRDSYVPGFRMTDAEYAKYEDLARRVSVQMTQSGETAAGWHLIGRCREVLRDRGGAVDAYGRALALDPKHGVSLYRKARISVERALSEDTVLDGGKRDEALATLADAARTIPEGAMERDLAEAYRLVIANPPEARAFCDQMLSRWEGRPYAEEFLLVAGIAGGRRKVMELATKAISRRPSYAWAYTLRGTSRLLLAEDLEAALEDFEQATRCDPRDPVPHNNRGAIRMRQGLHEAALRDFEQAIAADGTWVVPLSNAGVAKLKMGEAAAAVETLTRAIELDGSRPGVWQNRAEARAKAKDGRGAIEDYTKAIDLGGRSWHAFFGRGIALYGEGRYAEAEADFTSALNIAPQEPDGYINRAWVRDVLGRKTEAIQDLEEALRIAPRDWSLRAVAEKRLSELRR